MEKLFVALIVFLVPICSFGSETHLDTNTQAMTQLASNLPWIQNWPPSLMTPSEVLLVLLAIQFLLAACVTAFITFWFNRKLENFRFELRVREQAARVAELLAEARDGDPNTTSERAKRLNHLTWELSLWLPSEIVRELTRQLCSNEDRKTVKEILIQVRKHILGKSCADLAVEDITHFEPNKEIVQDRKND